MNELALFAGAGGGILGGILNGWRTVCAVEIDSYARRVLLARQRDGVLPRFPIWDDVKTFDGRRWRGYVDVVSGGFPCQDISIAGRGKGIGGSRSGLWTEFARIIGEVQPGYVFVENSPMLIVRGIERVLADLSEMGYDAQWGVIGADDVGAPHKRKRIWIVGYPDSKGLEGYSRIVANGDKPGRKCEEPDGSVADAGVSWWREDPADVPNAGCEYERCEEEPERTSGDAPGPYRKWGLESRLGRVVNGVAYRVDRLKGIGNGQVPAVAATAFRILSNPPY